MNTLVEARNITFIPSIKWHLTTEDQLPKDREERLSDSKPVTHVRITGIQSKKVKILENELKKTTLNLSLSVNIVIISISLLTFTKYAAPLVLISVAFLFRRLSHFTTLHIFLRRERDASAG